MSHSSRTPDVNAHFVLMLDEVDQLERDYRGDPASALLEILDSALNLDFRDETTIYPSICIKYSSFLSLYTRHHSITLA